MLTKKSKNLFSAAQKIMPGGVSSPVRAFKSVDSQPVFIDRALGSKIWDKDGNEYIDYVGSWGTAILGHSHPEVLEDLHKVIEKGLSFGASQENELKLAERIIEALPALDKVRFVNSGTEACMTAIRLSRGFTGKNKIIKFNGHYHGHSDSLLVQAGSGVATLGIPGSPGIPSCVTEETLSIPFNNLDILEQTIAKHKDEVACLILEPIVGNSGFIRPQEGFLKKIEQICHENKIILIFDEVMTGFRVAWGGAQNLFNIKPDLTTLGKIIGGGLPLAALGGREEIMDHLAPLGPVYQAGTLSGNPLATACGAKTLEILGRKKEDSYQRLNKTCNSLLIGFQSLANDYNLPFTSDYEGGMFGFFFSEKKVTNNKEAGEIDFTLFKKFFNNCLERGLYLAPSSYEAGFISLEHSKNDIDRTLEIINKSFKSL